MNFDPRIHAAPRAEGMTLVQVVPKNNPDLPGEYWLDPDGIHIHALWDITKAGKPDKRVKAQSLLRRMPSLNWQGRPYYAGHYVLATPENVSRLRAHEDKITALKMELDRAVAERDAEMALGLMEPKLDGGAA